MRYMELGLALLAGCIIGWWWGERPDVIREVPWLDAMTAFGTVGSAMGAVTIAWHAERSRRLELRDRAWHYATLKVTFLAEMRQKCSNIEFDVRTVAEGDWNGAAAKSITSKLADVENDLNSLDSLLLSKIDIKVGRLIFDTSLSLYRARQLADDLPGRKKEISNHLSIATANLLEVISTLDSSPEAEDF